MTKEEKELLLKDLCGRLQNKVMIYLHTSSEITGSAIVLTSSIYGFIEDVLNNSPYEIKEVKPYLRPLSSMTEEESREYRMFIDYSYNDFTSESLPCVYVKKIDDYLDWLNAHHFDYRNLITMGLALEASEWMYKN